MTWTELRRQTPAIPWKYVYVPMEQDPASTWFEWAIGTLDSKLDDPYYEQVEPYRAKSASTFPALTESLRHRGHGYRTRGHETEYESVEEFVDRDDVLVVFDLEKPLLWEPDK